MFIAFVLQVIVCFLILKWLLKNKDGEPYSKKAVIKFFGFGALSTVACLVTTSILPIEKDTFFGLNPILAGFITALLTAALFEEVMKYIFFRLALVKNEEVINWLDVIIATTIVGIGFTIAEDLVYAVTGNTNFLRALIPAHILFQTLMGYFYGKARVTKKKIYDVLSLAVPILVHTFFDMFLISMIAIIGDNPNRLKSLSEEELLNLPGWEYIIPLMICGIATMIIVFIAMVLMLRQIGVWNKRGEKRESLNTP